MENQVLSQDKIIEELNEVLQIDIDAIGAYQAAIDSIHEIHIISQLLEFKRDHERHVSELGGLVSRYGGKPKTGADLKGMLQKGFTKVAGLVGCEATLRAMLTNEKQTNMVYEKHCAKPFPSDILETLRRNFADEQRHFAWIQAAVEQRLWDQQQHVTT